jgi:SAM-dependent methyltransferase
VPNPSVSTANPPPGLSTWFSTPLGRYLMERERAYFDAEVADVFGYHALQFGLGEHDFLQANRMPYRAAIGLSEPTRVRTDFCELAVATASVDLVVLPHALEFSHNPHQLLREVQRILMPDGHIVISGFNPWSLWGAARLLAGRRGDFPWCGQFIGLSRIKDWLSLLNFELSSGRMAIYTPPCRAEKWLHRFRFLEPAGDRWWPFAGAVYFLHGVKRVHGARLITPKWRMAGARRKVFAPVPNKIMNFRDAVDPSRNREEDAS